MESSVDKIRDLVLETLAQYPQITALIVLAVGVGVAGVVRTAVRNVSSRIPGQLGESLQAPLRTASSMLFWVLLIASVFLMLQVLGVEDIASILHALLNPLGQVLIAGVILGAGHLLGVALRDFVRRRTTLGSSRLTSRLIYAVVISIAMVVCAGQLGLDVSFVGKLALIVFAVCFGSLGIAFALGSKQYVANLMARSELERYQVGDRLRIDEVEGTVVEVRSTILVLAMREGTVSIPAARLSESTVYHLTERGG